jgi:hypothetical protein
LVQSFERIRCRLGTSRRRECSPHRSFLCIKRRTAEVIVDGNLFDPGIDRRGIKPRLRIIGTWEPSVRSAML